MSLLREDACPLFQSHRRILRESILVVSENAALADAYVVTPEDPRRNWFAQHFRCRRWHTFAEKHQSLIDQNPEQSLIDQNPEQPTAKLAFVFKPLRMTRSDAPATSYDFFRAFRTAKDTTCHEVKHRVAAPEPGIKDQPLLIEPHSLREVRPRVISEMRINFAVHHASRLALMAKSVL